MYSFVLVPIVPSVSFIFFVLFLTEKSLGNINCLLVFLLVCPHFTDSSKNNARINEILFHTTWPKVIEQGELQSDVSSD